VRTYDVIIMGGGIAGGFLARQLKLTRPELSVLVLEAAQKIDNYKVGESTVEVAANYMIRRLNLGTYLYQHQLPKNGLRFFFDNEQKDLPLTKMSEIGSDHMPFHPSFQLERAALERDLVELNRAIGVDVELGAKVVDMSLDGESQHTVVYEQGGERYEASSRWLCDAAGRRHLIQRKLGNKVHKETRLNTAAAWARYRKVGGLDAVADPAWRSRVRYTSRHLSTNHMMYDGYWLWFIPLAGDLMSVGAVYDKDRISNGPRTKDDFEAFMRSHRSSRDLMEGAVFEDFQAYAHLPYYSDSYFSADRYALTGEAGAFTDPFYSPGSDFIATANEFITSLITTEMGEGKSQAFYDKVEAYNAYYRFKYESTIRLYIKLYPVFGTFEVYRLKYLLDFNNYYNLVVWPFMADRLTDVGWIREELRFTDVVLRAQSAMADHFVKMADHLRARGEYFAQNEGRWANGLCGVSQFEARLGPAIDEGFRRAEVDKAYGSVFAAVLERVLGEPNVGDRARVLEDLKLPQVLVWKDINEETYARFIDRIAGKIARDLKKELPDAGVERVVIRRANGGQNEGQNGADRASGAGDVHVIGPAEGGELHAKALARAREIWGASGGSLARIAM
jgi:flavin-dependent dehydrogenase